MSREPLIVPPTPGADAASRASDPEARLLETVLGPVSIAEEGNERATPLLCLHGIPGSHRDFRYLAPRLAGRFRVVRIEMPGFGATPPRDPASLDGWADTVEACVERLDAPRVILCAHSFGGGAALLAGRRLGARLGGLILIAAMGARRHRAFTLPAPAFGAIASAMRVPVLRGILARLTRRVYATNGLPMPEIGDVASPRRHVQLLASVRFGRLREAARSIAAPALLAHARDDRLVEIEIARELAGLLEAGTLHEFASGGHHLNKTRAAEIAALVLEDVSFT